MFFYKSTQQVIRITVIALVVIIVAIKVVVISLLSLSSSLFCYFPCMLAVALNVIMLWLDAYLLSHYNTRLCICCVQYLIIRESQRCLSLPLSPDSGICLLSQDSLEACWFNEIHWWVWLVSRQSPEYLWIYMSFEI